MELGNAQSLALSGVSRSVGSTEHAEATGVYTATCYDAQGNLKWTDTYKNIVTTYGKDMLLNTTFRAQTQSSFYLGLSKGYKNLSGLITTTTAGASVVGTIPTATTITGTTPTVTIASATVSIAATTNIITVTSTAGILPGMPVVFGAALTGSSILGSTTYYVLTVPSATTMTVSQVPGGASFGGTGAGTNTTTVTATSNTVTVTSATGIVPGMTMWVTGATTGGLTGGATAATTSAAGTGTKYYVSQVSGTTLTVSTTPLSPASYTDTAGKYTTTYTTGGNWGTSPTLTLTTGQSVAVTFTTSFSVELAVGSKVYDASYNLIGTVSTVTGDALATLAANGAYAVTAGVGYADPYQQATDTILSAPRWQEDLNYGAATRATPSFSASSAGSMQTSAAASFAINATTVIGGTFLIGGLTQKGSTTAATATGAATTGVLYSAGNFSGGNKSVASGDTLNVTYTASV